MLNIITFFLLLFIALILFYLYYKEKHKNKEIDSINQKIKEENKQIEN